MTILLSELLQAEPALYPLLIDAVEPLQHAFERIVLFILEYSHAMRHSLLKVVVWLPSISVMTRNVRLQTFDEDWWLNNCHRSGGALVFDYEM